MAQKIPYLLRDVTHLLLRPQMVHVLPLAAALVATGALVLLILPVQPVQEQVPLIVVYLCRKNVHPG